MEDMKKITTEELTKWVKEQPAEKIVKCVVDILNDKETNKEENNGKTV